MEFVDGFEWALAISPICLGVGYLAGLWTCYKNKKLAEKLERKLWH